MAGKALPEGFSQLEEFVADWIFPTEGERLAKRTSTDYAEIKRFYSAAIEAAPQALDLLKERSATEELPDEEARLSGLMLMLAEVAPAVELFGAPLEAGAYDPSKLEIVHEEAR
jgi:hypothetical protein